MQLADLTFCSSSLETEREMGFMENIHEQQSMHHFNPHAAFKIKFLAFHVHIQYQSSQVSCIEHESHTFLCNLTLSHSQEYFSCINTLLEGTVTLLFWPSKVLIYCKIPPIEGVNVPCFNKFVCFQRFQK